MKQRWLAVVIYGLFILWTGLQRSIEAAAFKPNAFFFCGVMSLLAIAGAYLIKGGFDRSGRIIASFAAVVALAYYLSSFMLAPQDDATVRVGLAIVSSLAALIALTLPKSPDS